MTGYPTDEELGHFIRAAADEARAHRRLGFRERRFWQIAQHAPFGARLIADEQNGPYLLRVYLTPENGQGAHRLPRFYLHHFFRGDADREVHNHPWPHALSLILTGGYIEYRWDADRRRMREHIYLPGMVNRIGRNDYHRVELVEPASGCWTLFMSYGRVGPSDGKDWGFLNPITGRITPWAEYVAEKSNG